MDSSVMINKGKDTIKTDLNFKAYTDVIYTGFSSFYFYPQTIKRL